MITIENIEKIEIHVEIQLDVVNDINEKLDILIAQGESTMTTVADIKAAIAAEALEVKARLDALAAEVQALKDAAAAGGTVTEADLAGILTDIQNIFTPGGIITPPFPGPTKTDINGNIIDLATGNMVSSDGTVRYAAGTFTAEPDGSHKDMAGNTILTSSIP